MTRPSGKAEAVALERAAIAALEREVAAAWLARDYAFARAQRAQLAEARIVLAQLEADD